MALAECPTLARVLVGGSRIGVSRHAPSDGRHAGRRVQHDITWAAAQQKHACFSFAFSACIRCARASWPLIRDHPRARFRNDATRGGRGCRQQRVPCTLYSSWQTRTTHIGHTLALLPSRAWQPRSMGARRSLRPSTRSHTAACESAGTQYTKLQIRTCFSLEWLTATNTRNM